MLFKGPFFVLWETEGIYTKGQQGKLRHGEMLSRCFLSQDCHLAPGILTTPCDNLSQFQLHPVPANERCRMGNSQRLDTLPKVT